MRSVTRPPFVLLTLLSLWLMTAICPPVQAACFDYTDGVNLGRRVEMPANIQGMQVAGDHGYVADGLGLRVLDVSDPADPQIVGELDIPYQASSLAVAGSYAYVGNLRYELYVVDVSDPAQPSIVATVELLHGVEGGIAAAGSFVYVECGGALVVIDASDPASPHVMGSVETWTGRPAAEGSTVYVLGGPGLTAIDVSDPSSPHLISTLTLPASRTAGIAVRDGYAYAGGSQDGPNTTLFWVIDISDPSAMQIAGDLTVPGQYSDLDIVLRGSNAYFAGPGLNIVDVSVPASPRLARSVPTGLQGDLGVAVAGSFAYLWGDLVASFLLVMDLTATEPFLGAVPVEGYAASTLAAAGKLACLGTDTGVHVVDLSDPHTPVVASRLDLAPAGPIVIADSAVYVVAQGTLQTWDLANPADPRVIGEVATGDVQALVVSGDRAYARGAELKVIDLSDPAHPAVVDSIAPGPFRSEYLAMAIGDDYACMWVAHYITPIRTDYRLDVIDIAGPGPVRIVGSTPAGTVGPGELGHLFPAGNRVYSISDYRITAIDLSDPTSPVVTSGIHLEHSGTPLVNGSLLYQNDAGDIHVSDISVPASPRPVGHLALRNSFSLLAFGGESLILAGGPEYRQSLMALLPPCVSPTPCLIAPVASARGDGILVTWIDAVRSGVSGYRVYRRIAGGEWEWECISDLLPALEEGNTYLDTTAEAGVAYEYEIEAYTRNGPEGRYGPVSAEMVAPARLDVRVWPNPGKGALELALILPRSEDVVLRLFDPQGRQVASSVLEHLRAGVRRASWEPRDGSGRRLASGAYFLRAASDRESQTVRWVTIR